MEKSLLKCNGNLCGDLDYCNKPSPDGVYVCTRKIGHSGNHISCSGSDHNLRIWNQKKRKQKSKK